MEVEEVTYEDFFSATDVATFKRVKKGQMKIAGICREVTAQMVGGIISEDGPEFLRTNVGVFRIAMSGNSDNTLERAAHDRMGAETVILEFDEQVEDFFDRHGLEGFKAKQVLKNIVTSRLRQEEEDDGSE